MAVDISTDNYFMASLNLPNVFENSKFPPLFSQFKGVLRYCIASWSVLKGGRLLPQICIRVVVFKRGRAGRLPSDLCLGLSGITQGYFFLD